MPTLKGLKKRTLRLRSRVAPSMKVRLPGGGNVVVDLRDDGGLNLALWGSTRVQPFAIQGWQRLTTLQPWDVIVDVGANYGEFSVAATRQSRARVLAIEPNLRVAGFLTQSLREADATVISAFAGSESGIAELVVTSNSRLGRKALPTGRGRGMVAVVTVSDAVDALALTKRPKNLLMKVDVEGAETEVLRGCAALFDDAQTVAVLVEAKHSGVERLREEMAGFEVWGWNRATDCLVPLPLNTDSRTKSIDIRDVVFTRGIMLGSI
jgi:FkbM family methyltransferase